MTRFDGEPGNRRLLLACGVMALLAGVSACVPPAAPQARRGLTSSIETVERAETAAGFIVRFAPAHALGRAHALQGAGRHSDASTLVRTTLLSDTALHGFCFDRFTLGGAEIVLNICAPSAADQTASAPRVWLERLTNMRGVAYAELNLVAHGASAVAAEA